MNRQQLQVFQTLEPTRWRRFMWVSRILLLVLVFSIAAIIISLFQKQIIHIPEIRERTEMYNKLTKKEAKLALNTPEQIIFHKSLTAIRLKKNREFYHFPFTRAQKNDPYYPVRAAFYVNWDMQSTFSLRNSIKSLNMVLPEWFFVPDSSNTISSNVDSVGLNIMRKNKVAIIPMLSNYFKDKWNGDNIHNVIHLPAKRKALISNIVFNLKKYKLNGINIDFEELHENTDEFVIQFQKELYAVLHPLGYLVTQDITPFNEDYNIQELAKYNDLIFVMAYDQHNSSTRPGPIAAQEWVEAALDDVCKKVPSEKLVLCLAAYGYDWPVGSKGDDVTYQEAVSTALEREGKVHYDDNTYNLDYTYFDDNNIKHQVYFTDAATTYNAMRAAEDFEVAGVAIWRLGSEDTRVWGFYKNNLSLKGLKSRPFDVKKFEDISSSYNVDFIGAGEILDILTTPAKGRVQIGFDKQDNLINVENYKTLPTCFVIKKTGEKKKVISLTFDDGPDPSYTPAILDILKKFKVPGTFFVTGINVQDNLPIVKRIYDEGHEIGNHTLLHPNLELLSDDRIRLELRATGRLIEGITGHATILFRPPYDTDAEPVNPDQIHPLWIAKEENYLTIGSSIDPLDWQKGVSADSIYARIVRQQALGNILLLHDAGGMRNETVKALPRIIEYFKKQGFQFVSISDLMGRKRDDIMPKEVGLISQYLEKADYVVLMINYAWDQIIYSIFFLALILSAFKIVAVAFFAFLQHCKNKKMPFVPEGVFEPLISIIVPAYNEEITGVKTIENLLRSNYNNFEIIFIDDGSTDKTYELIKDRFDGNEKVKIFTKPNSGKAASLNYGISHANGEIMVCIDADTILDTNAVARLVIPFMDVNVGAVGGNVKVGNKINLLTRWQSIEYTTSQNFDRLAYDYINTITVVPGAIGAFRGSALKEIGGFDIDTLAEDCDLTLRMLRAGYRVRACNDAFAYTEVPESMKMFMKQRFRWSFGIMQSFWKHRELIFTRRRLNLSWVLLPNLLIFQMILPLFSPLVDLMMLFSLFSFNGASVFSGNIGQVGIFYIGYYILDVLISMMAFHYDGQKFTFRTAWNLFLQRIIYRLLLFVVLFKSYRKAIKGELTGWGVLKRTGNVEHVKVPEEA
jgi:cellulose synthase/poly-beta-1,6-N-acetylglucosamine synthase-like glycosyltransferase/peptidoglycan/xylan/chitin deacetylase (PgdA/CDA1 family)/spore germination protein YaaH